VGAYVIEKYHFYFGAGMIKKHSSKKYKARSSKQGTTGGDANVISLIGRLEKRTEKQMADFVKEIVKLKKSQVKIQKKLEKPKPKSKVNATTPKPKAKKGSKSSKKKKPRLKIVE